MDHVYQNNLGFQTHSIKITENVSRNLYVLTCCITAPILSPLTFDELGKELPSPFPGFRVSNCFCLPGTFPPLTL